MKAEPLADDYVPRLQFELKEALNSLGGRPCNGLLDAFNCYSATHIDRAADAYVLLKQANREEALPLLIRPAMEAMFRLLAVRSSPNVLYRLAYHEHLQDKKWATPFAPDGVDSISFFANKWSDFAKLYAEQFPDYDLSSQDISLRQVAELAGIAPYYDSHYRLYCQHTHAALSACAGYLTEFHTENDRTMAACIICALEAVVSTGGASRNLDQLRAELIPPA